MQRARYVAGVVWWGLMPDAGKIELSDAVIAAAVTSPIVLLLPRSKFRKPPLVSDFQYRVLFHLPCTFFVYKYKIF
jgi:hypothetical protein